MDRNINKFTISIPENMEEELSVVKQKFYCQKTQTDMIRDLIRRGLESLKEDEPVENRKCCEST